MRMPRLSTSGTPPVSSARGPESAVVLWRPRPSCWRFATRRRRPRPFAPAASRALVFVPAIVRFPTATRRRFSASAARTGPQSRLLLLYEDLAIESGAARQHRAAYGLGSIAAAIDADGAIASAAGATVTPEAVVIDSPEPPAIEAASTTPTPRSDAGVRPRPLTISPTHSMRCPDARPVLRRRRRRSAASSSHRHYGAGPEMSTARSCPS